ncbi:MAG TPA: ArsA-related P-loop ATPase [Solirubrobacteraceae bacterium]|nr:ArsA-related P-loop ATPase [Solirubrobacteraceae bacterium]
MSRSLFDRNLIYVTGKGGVGKTTAAAALGLAAAARGRRTIVCEVADQHNVSRAFASAGVSTEEEARLAEDLYAITVDPQHALEEWLSRQVGGRALKVLTHSSAFQYFVAAAPGAKELITIAKIWELAQGRRWTKTNRTYDLVIVDAPASGHGLAMLQTPRTFGDIARVGPIQRQAYKVRDMLADPSRSAYVAVALPEEMPVNETLEMQDKLVDATGLDFDAIVVNGLYPERFSRQEADALRELAERDGHPPQRAAALRAALAADDRARSQRSHLRRLRREARSKVVTLPFVFDTDLGLEDYRAMGNRLAGL